MIFRFFAHGKTGTQNMLIDQFVPHFLVIFYRHRIILLYFQQLKKEETFDFKYQISMWKGKFQVSMWKKRWWRLLADNAVKYQNGLLLNFSFFSSQITAFRTQLGCSNPKPYVKFIEFIKYQLQTRRYIKFKKCP